TPGSTAWTPDCPLIHRLRECRPRDRTKRAGASTLNGVAGSQALLHVPLALATAPRQWYAPRSENAGHRHRYPTHERARRPDGAAPGDDPGTGRCKYACTRAVAADRSL